MGRSRMFSTAFERCTVSHLGANCPDPARSPSSSPPAGAFLIHRHSSLGQSVLLLLSLYVGERRTLRTHTCMPLRGRRQKQQDVSSFVFCPQFIFLFSFFSTRASKDAAAPFNLCVIAAMPSLGIPKPSSRPPVWSAFKSCSRFDTRASSSRKQKAGVLGFSLVLINSEKRKKKKKGNRVRLTASLARYAKGLNPQNKQSQRQNRLSLSFKCSSGYNNFVVRLRGCNSKIQFSHIRVSLRCETHDISRRLSNLRSLGAKTTVEPVEPSDLISEVSFYNTF